MPGRWRRVDERKWIRTRRKEYWYLHPQQQGQRRLHYCPSGHQKEALQPTKVVRALLWLETIRVPSTTAVLNSASSLSKNASTLLTSQWRGRTMKKRFHTAAKRSRPSSAAGWDESDTSKQADNNGENRNICGDGNFRGLRESVGCARERGWFWW
jgi:hypothetical protein